ncbi:MAG: GNAT family N-acetyltransferase [archaeon GB-1867-035]|nr:GNAT family N-acetyltransferase [Candidatus Culexmicrobium profundum]
MGVNPKFHRKGMESFLVLKALQRLNKRGFKQALVEVDKQNIAAINLFKNSASKTLKKIIELKKPL